MGRSTHVTAYIDGNDSTYKKHAKVLIACYEANISLPIETEKYFGCKEAYLELLDERLETKIPLHEWRDENSEGYEIFVSDIPQGTHKIRFYNSW